MNPTRNERDTLGTVQVPAQRLWGAQTQRSLAHFAISTERLPAELIEALARIKRAAARVNAELGLLPAEVAEAIAGAADEIVAGRHGDEFPLSVWQTGSGTQTHMNLNEVLANRASELLGGGRGEGRRVHPNDQVNLGQSTNDVFPSALHLAAADGIDRRLLPALRLLHAALLAKAEEFAGLVKIGRTHLQDATPLTLGQEFSGYVAQLEHARLAIEAALPGLFPLAIGGTAVGTGLNTHPRFGEGVARRLAAEAGLPLLSAANKFAALAGHEPLVTAHGALKTLAVALNKIANDLRWLASGPRCGLGEIALPENEPGSSMMPGKVNPTQCEAVAMLCVQVIANDLAVTLGAASGHFELNVYQPLIAHNLLQSIRLLTDGMAGFEKHCVAGISARRDRLAENVERSLMRVTALVPHLGYERAAEIARRAERENGTLRDAALALGYASAEELDRWLRAEAMLAPGEREVR